MSLNRELAAVSAKALSQEDKFYAHASTFPERLRRLLREHLEAPADHLLKSRKIAEGPAWEWPRSSRGAFDGTDLDHEGYITFGISSLSTLRLPGAVSMRRSSSPRPSSSSRSPAASRSSRLSVGLTGVLVDTDRFGDQR
jgi:hypothetical protein